MLYLAKENVAIIRDGKTLSPLLKGELIVLISDDGKIATFLRSDSTLTQLPSYQVDGFMEELNVEKA